MMITKRVLIYDVYKLYLGLGTWEAEKVGGCITPASRVSHLSEYHHQRIGFTGSQDTACNTAERAERVVYMDEDIDPLLRYAQDMRGKLFRSRGASSSLVRRLLVFDFWLQTSAGILPELTRSFRISGPGVRVDFQDSRQNQNQNFTA